MTQIIEVIMLPNGQTKVETRGFAGASCREASRFIEEALGQRIGEQLSPSSTRRRPPHRCTRTKVHEHDKPCGRSSREHRP